MGKKKKTAQTKVSKNKSGNINTLSIFCTVFAMIKKIIKVNYKLILLLLSMSLMSFAMIYCRMRDLGLSLHSKRGIIIIAILIVVTFVIGLILYWAKEKKWKIEKVYLVCGLIVGMLYCVVLPVGAVPDEPSHFWRTYGLAEGDLIMEKQKTKLPVEIYSLSQGQNFGSEAYRNQINNFTVGSGEEYKEVGVSAYGYPPFNYMPQIVGVWISKIFQIPVIPMFILCRILNMVFCTIIIYFCIKYIPVLKKMIFLIAFFPMTMQLFASISADGSIICAGMSLITYVLYARKTMKRKIGIWDFLLLLIICLVLAVAKPVYALLCPIVFWIPKERFKDMKWKIGSIFLLGGLTFAVVLTKIISAPLDSNIYGSIEGQYDVVFHDPMRYSLILFKSSILEWYRYVNWTIGSSLEWFSVGIYDVYIITFLLFFAFLCAERDMKITAIFRLFSFFAFTLIMVMTFTTFFVTWTKPGTEMIEGVQGRYFLPVLLLIPLFCMPSVKSRDKDMRKLVPKGYLYTFATLANIYAILIIFCSHI